MTKELNKAVAPEVEGAVKQLNITLKQAQQTLADISGSVGQDSALYVMSLNAPCRNWPMRRVPSA